MKNSGKSKSISVGKKILLKGRAFCIAKYKITNRFIPDSYSYEYAVILGDPNEDNHRIIEVKKDAALAFIEKNKMAVTERNDNGKIWELPGRPYKEAYEGTYRNLAARMRAEYEEHLKKLNEKYGIDREDS